MSAITLPEALRAWDSEWFAGTLKGELEQLEATQLPLQQGISQGSYVGEAPLTVSVLQFVETPRAIEAKVGIFFTEIVASCGCGDEPMPINAYCVLRVTIDKASAAVEFEVLSE